MIKLEEMFNVQDKCILVTGACGYFGSFIVKELLKLKTKVIALSHSILDLNDYMSKLKQPYHENIYAYNIDFYDERQIVIEKFKLILEQHKIDVIINNACDMSYITGFNTTRGRLENCDYSKWNSSLESGVTWAFLTTQIIGRQMIKRKEGSIINISSMYSSVAPNPNLYKGNEYFNPPGYSISKAGLNALTRYTASFWGKYNIRCNAIAPGPFPKDVSDEFLNRLKKETVLNRVGKLQDLIGLIAYLASDASSFMTGQVINLDGGWTVT